MTTLTWVTLSLVVVGLIMLFLQPIIDFHG
jgi:hypothetical protein